MTLGDLAPDDFELRWAPAATAPHLDRLQIDTRSDTIWLGERHKLRALGFDQTGEPIPVPVSTWQSDDPGVVTVDESTGVVHPRRAGVVTVRVSAGGWREAKATLAVVSAPPAEVVLSENWSRGIEAQWVPFGDPQPDIVIGPDDVRAFWNQGDGHFLSGAHSRSRYPATRGLGLEARVSTRIVGPRQQFVALEIQSALDSVGLARWDHRTGGIPFASMGHGACMFHYGGDGVPTPPVADIDGVAARLPADVNSGRWYTVRLQIFTDGRCGLAVDGKALAVSDNPLPLNRRYWIVVAGNSLGTKILVGPLEVWEGVRTDVDWTALSVTGTEGRRR